MSKYRLDKRNNSGEEHQGVEANEVF